MHIGIDVFKEGDRWVAHCTTITIDVAAEGTTIPHALEELITVWIAKFGEDPPPVAIETQRAAWLGAVRFAGDHER